MHFPRITPVTKGYKCYSPKKPGFIVSMDVTFIENQHYYPKSNVQGESESMDDYQFWDKNNSIITTEVEPYSHIFQNPLVPTPTSVQNPPLSNTYPSPPDLNEIWPVEAGIGLTTDSCSFRFQSSG